MRLQFTQPRCQRRCQALPCSIKAGLGISAVFRLLVDFFRKGTKAQRNEGVSSVSLASGVESGFVVAA